MARDGQTAKRGGLRSPAHSQQPQDRWACLRAANNIDKFYLLGFAKFITAENSSNCHDAQQYFGVIVNGVGENVFIALIASRMTMS
jgi:hypothetical protein